MARNASRETELFEQALHSLQVLRNVGIKFAVGSLHVRLCNQPRTAVARTNNVNHVEIVAFDDSIQVNIDEVEAGSGAPMSKKARLDVLALEWFFQERIVQQIDLAHRKIV